MPKVVIVVLVVVAVAFVVTLALGFSNHGDEADAERPPGLIDALSGVRGSRFMRVEGDVRSDCRVNSPTRLTIEGSCAVVVPSRGAFSRPLRVTVGPVSGSFNVSFRRVEGEAVDESGLPNSDATCFESAIDRHGAVVALSCAGPGPCVVELVQGEC